MSEHAEQTTGASVARSGAWETAGQVLPQAYVFVTSVAIARYLGPSTFGRIALITGIQLAVTTVITWGFPYAVSRTVAEELGAGRSERVRAFARWAYLVVAGAAAVAFAVMFGAALAGATPYSVWVLAGLTAAGAVLHSVPSSLLIGAQRWREARIMGITTGTVSAAAKVVALALGAGIVALFAIEFVIVLANLAGTTTLAGRYLRLLPKGDADRAAKRRVLSFAGVVGISTVVNLVVYQRTEIFVLAHYRSDTEIARYSVPYSMVTTLLLLPTAASAVLSPAVATLWGAGAIDRIRSGVGRTLRLVLTMTIVVAGALIAIGPAFVRLLYGPGFAHVAAIMFVLALGLPIVPIGTISASVLRAVGTLRWLTTFGVVGAVANVVLAFALIAPFGAVGAAAANSTAQIAVALPLLLIVRRQVRGIDLGGPVLLRCAALVAAAALLAFLVVDALPLGLRVPAGAVVFSAVMLAGAGAVRILSRDDAWWLVELLGGRVLGIPARLAAWAGGVRAGRVSRHAEVVHVDEPPEGQEAPR